MPEPPFRRLAGYAFDPSLSLQSETALINEIVFRVTWEKREVLEPGPIGEYLEVVDFDPASDCFYAPVDLDDPLLLAQDGLPPSEGNPQFHQQMVYAVAMTTIRNFERALGRRVLWADRSIPNPPGSARPFRHEFTQRLRIYPHALREANAYYSPDRRALLFGYFPAAGSQLSAQIPGGTVFTCLSHDIVAHETTHALLDGIHGRFVESTGPDGPAFHEAFADIVALFQHFTFPEVLRHQIARKRGDLESQSLLGELAQQFGQAIGQRCALREALGGVDEATGEWKRKAPDPSLYSTVLEPHARGSILVAAVFEAFLTIYRGRVQDLFRLATNGTGVLPPGAIHPDLVNRLAAEAAKSAQHVLNMCVRALDYCPPVDIKFGDYLRALVTADFDLVPDDDMNYRVAFIESFRRWGVYPKNVRALSVDSLCWHRVREDGSDVEAFAPISRKLREHFLNDYLRDVANPRTTREAIFQRSRALSVILHGLFADAKLRHAKELEEITGLVFRERRNLPGIKPKAGKWYPFEVHAVRPAQRVGPDGDALNQLIIVLTQRRLLPLDPANAGEGDPHFWFRGGCTLLLDLDTFELKYAISKRVDRDERVERQRDWLEGGEEESLRATYFGRPGLVSGGDSWSRRTAREPYEPFALLHRGV